VTDVKYLIIGNSAAAIGGVTSIRSVDPTGSIVPGIKVEQSGYVSFALQCRHCDDAPCIEACMTGAMHRDAETGAVLCDAEKCVGCWMCIMVCPVGAVARGANQQVASKCDLCIGVATPVCVANCPNEAIVLEEDDE
jgi:anaerobic carbon-monoxide dehydrogenase iron sulfur subunit